MRFRLENKHKIVLLEAEDSEQALKIAKEVYGMDNPHLKIEKVKPNPMQKFEDEMRIAVKKLRKCGW